VVLACGPAAEGAVPSSCGGPDDPAFTAHRVITGEFGQAQQGSYVMLPFQVPAGTTAVRVRYCYDQPDVKPPGSPVANTLDMGVYDARQGPQWDAPEFRGWGGSSHPDVTVSPNGFSSEHDYLANPKGYVHGTTTRGFVPGPIPPGQWAVELGVASVTPVDEGNLDGKVAWRVEIDTTDDPTFADHPYQPTPYDTTPANPDPGWYEGDMHVHDEFSNLGAATIRETLNYAFSPQARGGAGLDFLSLSDYVGTDQWGEIGRYQPDYPGHLIQRAAEVITYHGHTNNQVSHTWADYRTGPIYLRYPSGKLVLMRHRRPPSTIFDTVHAAGGWTQINHPTIFPSQVPTFSSFCRGCPWDYSDKATDYRKVDAIEVSTGPAGTNDLTHPGPNPFTPLALQFYEHAIDANGFDSNHIAAVGSSDSHTAGRYTDLPGDIPGAPIGEARTVVRAPELSEQGIESGVKAGHTYVKLWGPGGPDVRFTAAGGGQHGMMGDTLHAPSARFDVHVLHLNSARAARPGIYTLFVYRNGLPWKALALPTSGDNASYTFRGSGPARYRLQIQRLAQGVAAIETVTSPIYLAP
jgi:hypothetical protein